MKQNHSILQKKIFDKVEENDVEGLKQLLHGISIKDIRNDFGYSLLHRSIAKGFDIVSVILIEHGVDLNPKDKDGQTPLHYAAFYGNLRIAQSLLINGADLNITDNYGNQPLWTAVFNDKGFGKRIDIIRLFVENGAAVNHKNNVGKSPLDFAVTNKYTQAIELLRLGKQ